MSYTYDYPRPAVTTDCLIFHASQARTSVLLIQRKNPPFKGKWAFPGGFVEIDEEIIDGAYRELKEETGITGIELYQFRTYGTVNRDPRGRTISIVYYGFLKESSPQVKAGSDAENIKWFDIHDLPELAFDHDSIIADAIHDLAPDKA